MISEGMDQSRSTPQRYFVVSLWQKMEVLVNTIAQWDKKECLKFFIQWSKNRPNLKDFQTGCLRNNFATTTTTKFQFGVFKQVSTKFLRRRSFTLWSREDLHKCQVLASVVFFGFGAGCSPWLQMGMKNGTLHQSYLPVVQIYCTWTEKEPMKAKPF